MEFRYKGYIIKPSAIPSSFSIAVEGRGGKIPKSLDSIFTSSGLAKQAIDLYKETKDGETGSESGG